MNNAPVSRITKPTKPQQPSALKAASVDDGLVELIETLQAIDCTRKMASLNATTMDDNNGGRILL